MKTNNQQEGSATQLSSPPYGEPLPTEQESDLEELLRR